MLSASPAFATIVVDIFHMSGFVRCSGFIAPAALVDLSKHSAVCAVFLNQSCNNSFASSKLAMASWKHKILRP